MFRQDDDHTFLREDQIEDEISDIMEIADELYETFGLTYKAELSTRPDDFMGDPELWDKAEDELKDILIKKYGEGGTSRSMRATARSMDRRSTCP